MGAVNYELLVSELIKPLTTRPEAVVVKVISEKDDVITIEASVHKDDLGRVIGKKGRVASAIRTLAYTAAIREKQHLEINFLTDGEEVKEEE